MKYHKKVSKTSRLHQKDIVLRMMSKDGFWLLGSPKLFTLHSRAQHKY